MNPKRLKAWYKKRDLEIKQRFEEIDIIAWTIGRYGVSAVNSGFTGKDRYPEKPYGFSNNAEDKAWGSENGQHKEFNDGDRFAAFAAQHNKELRKKKKLKAQREARKKEKT